MKGLIGELERGDWNRRMRAVHLLGYEGEEGFRGLALAARDGDWQVRMAAMNSLFPLAKYAAPVWRRTIKEDPCRVVRLTAFHNIGSLESADDEAKVIADIFHDEPNAANRCDEQAGPGLLGEGERPAAAPVVGAEPDPPFAPPAEPEPPSAPARAAVAPPPAPPDPPVPTRAERLAAVEEIAWVEPENARPRRKVEGAADFAGVDRRVVDPSLAPGRRSGAEPALAAGFAAPPPRPQPETSGAAFHEAGGKTPHDALPALIAALKDPDPRRRSRAADELGKRGAAARSAVPSLMEAMKDKSARVRASAAMALGGAGAEEAVPLLVAALKDKSADARFGAATALSRLKTPAAHEAFDAYMRAEARRTVEKR